MEMVRAVSKVRAANRKVEPDQDGAAAHFVRQHAEEERTYQDAQRCGSEDRA